MHNLKLIIKREYLARVRNKTFVVMTFLSPLILVGMIMLITYLTTLNNSGEKTVGIYDESGIFATSFKNTEEINYTDLSALPFEIAQEKAQKENFYGLLYVPKDVVTSMDAGEIKFFSKETPGFTFLENIERKISEKLTNIKLANSGVDLNQLESAETNVNLDLQNYSGVHTSRISSYVKMFFGGAAGYLLMMFIIIYGNMVMRSVIEEKTNRIVEIIISSVKPIHLMWGKILGTSFAGITQFIIWLILGGVLLLVVSSVVGIDVSAMETPQKQAMEQMSQNEMQQLIFDIASLPILKLILFFLIYFIGGYFLYSAIYAAIGAAVDNETDTQQFMLPIILPLMLGIYVGFFSVIENPHGSISTIFSMIPLTSPIVMLMRIPFGVPWWELLISVIILVTTIWGVAWIASKIYRIGILMYGKKPSYKELYKWLKY
ncbi:MAG TPA: ABC transporter permease [Salinimicrobium sp.]|nr:ABC transporter permease [Salinimicrobium sp.]